MSETELKRCAEQELRREAKQLARLLSSLDSDVGREPWESLAWQAAKHLVARRIAACLCRAGCRVYMLDMHGGEPSPGMGGKDIDLAIEGCGLDPRHAEESLEAAAAAVLQEVLRRDPYRALSIPNIVELHRAEEYLVEKYIKFGPPYARRLC